MPQGVWFPDHIFQIPSFAQGNRASRKKANQVSADARDETPFVFEMQKWIKREPSEGGRGATRAQPTQAKLAASLLSFSSARTSQSQRHHARLIDTRANFRALAPKFRFVNQNMGLLPL
jgi:hypothetical protein